MPREPTRAPAPGCRLPRPRAVQSVRPRHRPDRSPRDAAAPCHRAARLAPAHERDETNHSSPPPTAPHQRLANQARPQISRLRRPTAAALMSTRPRRLHSSRSESTPAARRYRSGRREGARAEAPASRQRSCLAHRFDHRLTAGLDETEQSPGASRARSLAAAYLCRPSVSRRGLVVLMVGRSGDGGACGRSGWWSWCARAPGLISVRDPAVQPVGDVMVDGVIPLG